VIGSPNAANSQDVNRDRFFDLPGRESEAASNQPSVDSKFDSIDSDAGATQERHVLEYASEARLVSESLRSGSELGLHRQRVEGSRFWEHADAHGLEP
jgi:hypothetical protein